MEDRTAADQGEIERGGQRHADQPIAGAQGGSVNAGVKRVEPGQPDAAHQREASAADDQKGKDDGGPKGNIGHSITSPRMRNFPRAAVLTKPRTPMISETSKNSGVPTLMPTVSSISMPTT